MVQDAEVKVKLKAEGAEETKARLLETRAALVGVSSEQLKNAQTQRQAARDANVLNNAESYRTRIYLAQHPILNQVTRGLCDFAGVGRNALAITTAISTAYTAFGKVNEEAAQIQAHIAEKQRELAIEMAKAFPDPMIVANLTGDLHALNAEMDANKQAEQQGFIANLLIIGSTVATAGHAIAAVVTKIGASFPHLTSLTTAFGSIPTLVAQAGAVMAGFFAGTWLRENVLPDWFKKPIDDFFFKGIPDAVAAGVGSFLGFGRSLADIWPTIQDGFTSFWNGMVNTVTSAVGIIIKSVRSVIDAIAKLPGKAANAIGGGIASLVGSFFPSAGAHNARANGGMITEPVMGVGLNSGQTWSFGEAGPEMVIPSGGRGGGGGGRTINVYATVEGSLLAQRELDKGVDKAMKDTLKRHGW